VRVALLFIDGVGVGRRDTDVNPLARSPYLLAQFRDAAAESLPYGGTRLSLDTRFGMPGRPQSASNQTAILTAEPAPSLVGGHVLGHPNAPLRALLSERSIVKRLVAAGRSAAFLNAYPVEVLQLYGVAHRPSPPEGLELPPRWRRRMRPSASTCAMAAGGVALRTFDDARRGEALTHDIDGRRARERGMAVPERTPEEAARLFWAQAAGADFTMFEHYLADEAGHAQDFDAAKDALETFDRFLREVAALRPADTEILVCSDHGNVEDLSTRQHTLHDVPLLRFGDQPLELAPRNVADVGRLVLQRLGVEP
jgi:hypothetical protein